MDVYHPLLKPAVLLIIWTIVVMMVMAVRRAQGFRHHKVDLRSRKGGRGPDLDGKVEPKFQWPAHNYMHLVEQPTLFYAIILILVAMGDSVAFNVTLAWAYLIIRVLHSIWQISVNSVPVRLSLFILSSLCLLGLTLHAAIALFSQ